MCVGLLAALTALAYGLVWSMGYLYDDANWVLAPLWDARAPFALAAWLGGGLPWAFHGLVVGLHLVNGLLLYRLVRRWLSVVGGLTALTLFWLHPIQVESVAYISGGLEVLLTTYILVALTGLLAARMIWRVSGLIVLGAACTLKWSALPAVLVVAYLVGSWQIGLTLATVVAVVLGWHWPTITGWMVAETLRERLESLRLLSVALWRYLGLVVWPAGFSVEHDWLAIPVWLGWVAVAGLGALGLLASRMRVTAMAWIWVVGLVLPRALIPRVPPLTEHHTLVPFLAVWLLVGAAVDVLTRERIVHA